MSFVLSCYLTNQFVVLQRLKIFFLSFQFHSLYWHKNVNPVLKKTLNKNVSFLLMNTSSVQFCKNYSKYFIKQMQFLCFFLSDFIHFSISTIRNGCQRANKMSLSIQYFKSKQSCSYFVKFPSLFLHINLFPLFYFAIKPTYLLPPSSINLEEYESCSIMFRKFQDSRSHQKKHFLSTINDKSQGTEQI